MKTYDQLRRYSLQMGLEIVPRPQTFELEKTQLYPSGVLQELAHTIMELESDKCISMNYEALTNSNISTLHGYVKSHGHALHCYRNGNKRVLFSEIRK